jgi:tetratricopeptide (TPR) repeat protein
MPESPPSKQSADGSYIAQAEGGSTATVNVYQSITHYEIAPETIEAALQHLTELPTEIIPDPGPLPLASRMPFVQNPTFVGRETGLQRLATALKAGGGTAAVGQIAAATGLGGIGKTQLASEFCHRYGQYFTGGVFWLNFADPKAIQAEISACGGAGHLALREDYSNRSLGDQVRLVLGAWLSELPRLLVFDNCEDEDLIWQWRPPSGGCRILVTSRRTQWSTTLGVQSLSLGVLTPSESIALLRKFRPDLSEDNPDLGGIAETLGHLPLALHLAGSFLKRYDQTSQGIPATYLAKIQQPDLLAHRSMTEGETSPNGHELHVAKTFALSFDQLDQDEAKDALALQLLVSAACFAPGEPIPRPLLLAVLTLAKNDEDTELQTADALRRLNDLGLISLEADGGLLLHRLLQAFVQQESRDYADAQTAVETAVLDEAQINKTRGYLAWQSHLHAVAENAAKRHSKKSGSLLNALGLHLYRKADFITAQDCFERALAIDEATFGPVHPTVATNVNNLGLALKAQGNLAGARDCFERALAIDEAIFGSVHPKVASDINNLGLVLKAQCDLTGARNCFERALAIDEATFGPVHPKVATRVNNLGNVLRAQCDLVGAQDYLERALTINEAVFDSDHPNVATCINNLGDVLRAQCDLVGAQDCFKRALTINETAFDSGHPNVASGISNLGGVLHDQGDLAGAQDCFERALTINEAVFGPVHPKVAISVNNLGKALQDQGDLVGARDCYQRTLTIFETTLGIDHPDTQAVRSNIASLE